MFKGWPDPLGKSNYSFGSRNGIRAVHRFDF
jgi:hypothetical protein